MAGESAPEPGKETTLRCREFPQYSYSVLLPDGYDASTPYPILYTLSPGGGGMVAKHQGVSQVQPSIIVGITGYRNGKPEREYGGEIYAVMLDTLDRFNVDPAAQYAGGFYGGAVAAYILARQYKERISGVIASGGWLQNMYDPCFAYPRGLLVARVCAVHDKGANQFATKDRQHLEKAGCRVQDWSQDGGHAVGSPQHLQYVMRWFVLEKICDVTGVSAAEQSTRWARNPHADAVIEEVLEVVKTRPRTRLGQLALGHLFGPGTTVVDPVAGLAFAGASASVPDSPPFNRLVYAAALVKNGRTTEAAKAAAALTVPPDDPKLSPVVADLTKCLNQESSALDAGIWLGYFGEGD